MAQQQNSNKNNSGNNKNKQQQFNLPTVLLPAVTAESEKLLKDLLKQLDEEMRPMDGSKPSKTLGLVIKELSAYEKKVFMSKLTSDDLEKLRHIANPNNFKIVASQSDDRKNYLLTKWEISKPPTIVNVRVDMCLDNIMKQNPAPAWTPIIRKAINTDLELKNQLGNKIMELNGNEALAFIKTLEFTIDSNGQFDKTIFKSILE